MSTDTRTPPKTTDVELTSEYPYLRLDERYERRRERGVAAGFMALVTAVSLPLDFIAVGVIAAAMAGYLLNDYLTWEAQYGTGGETA